MLRLFRRRPPLARSKLALIDYAMDRLNVRTFADLGGVWAVEAGYTFYALDRGAVSGVLVDTHPTATVLRRARAYPRLRVIPGNFGADAVASAVGPVEAVFMFDTLLHQVDPNWDAVLELYASRARCVLVHNPQWVGPGRTLRLFDLGETEYFENVPHLPDEGPYAGLFEKLDTPHPEHGGRHWRDVHNVWQWGITDADLVARMENLGYGVRRYENCGRFQRLRNFESHAFVFSR